MQHSHYNDGDEEEESEVVDRQSSTVSDKNANSAYAKGKFQMQFLRRQDNVVAKSERVENES